MSDVTVSAIMTVYNTARFLPEAVESTLAQSWRDFEFIIIDDGSTDDSLAVLRRYGTSDPRIRLVTGPNQGIPSARNQGIAMARGRFMAVMDSDDIALPGRFARQVEYLRGHPGCVAVGAQALRIDAEGLPIGVWSMPRTHQEIDARHLAGFGGNLVHPTAMVRIDALRRVGGYSPSFRYAADLDLWLRLAEIGELANLPDVLLKYRLHESSVTFSRRKQQCDATDIITLAARRRRGLAAIPMPEWRESVEQTLFDKRKLWVDWAEAGGHLETACKHARWIACRQPLRARAWKRYLRLELRRCLR